MAAFGIAWPLAVLVAEWVIRRLGHVVETAQSGDALRDMGRRRTEKVSATT
jgi:hypothetical protein